MRCEHCGLKFERRKHNQRFCTRRCKEDHRKQRTPRRPGLKDPGEMGNSYYRMTDAEREAIDLPPLRPGVTRCLRCGRQFETWSTTLNRLCRECRHVVSYWAPEAERG